MTVEMQFTDSLGILSTVKGLENPTRSGLVRLFRLNHEIVGVWTKLASNGTHFFEQIVFQHQAKGNIVTRLRIPLSNESPRRLLVKEAQVSEGKLVFRRRQGVGYPTRMTVFVADNGKEDILEEREF